MGHMRSGEDEAESFTICEEPTCAVGGIGFGMHWSSSPGDPPPPELQGYLQGCSTPPRRSPPQLLTAHGALPATGTDLWLQFLTAISQPPTGAESLYGRIKVAIGVALVVLTCVLPFIILAYAKEVANAPAFGLIWVVAFGTTYNLLLSAGDKANALADVRFAALGAKFQGQFRERRILLAFRSVAQPGAIAQRTFELRVESGLMVPYLQVVLG